ncbi:hypothetical protein ACIBQX_38805 [Nonomuraea sp. NPDC049714]|uniref:hypothetical protein n=1 Tax=Nonomuraea sp. NPDC049714 TaxID=3364357 RepID=UPI00378ECA0D
MLVRKIGTLAAGLVTATVLMGGPSPTMASTTISSGADAAAAGCLSVVDWYNEKISQYVKVKNTCSSTKSYCVDINNWPDKGAFTISGNTTKSQRYAGIAAPTGRGIYSC